MDDSLFRVNIRMFRKDDLRISKKIKHENSTQIIPKHIEFSEISICLWVLSSYMRLETTPLNAIGR